MFFRLPVVRFFNRVINRATVTVALVLLQIGWLLWAFFSLTAGKVWVNAGLNVLSLFITLYLVRKDENSDYKIIWLVLIGMMPLLGGALHATLLTHLEQLQQHQGNTIEIRYTSHEQFKKQTADSQAVIRSGECSPYANIILCAGVTF